MPSARSHVYDEDLSIIKNDERGLRPGSTMTAVSTAISQGWAWKERDASIASVLDEVGSSWTDAVTFPSEIHVELLKAGRIPDPFKGSNEHEVQWIGEREWLYHTKFGVPEAERSWKSAELVFEGLDTLCDVYLNGKKVLHADNMFRTWSVSLSRDDLRDQDNLLLLHFTSAKKLAKELEAQYGRVRAGSTNLGDPISSGAELEPFRAVHREDEVVHGDEGVLAARTVGRSLGLALDSV